VDGGMFCDDIRRSSMMFSENSSQIRGACAPSVPNHDEQ